MIREITNDDKFPGWTFQFFDLKSDFELGNFYLFIASLYSEMSVFTNFNKLRILLFDMIKKDNEYALVFLLNVVTHENSKCSYINHQRYFIETLNVIEDISYFDHYVKENITQFKQIVKEMSELPGKFSVNFPNCPDLQFYDYIYDIDRFGFDNTLIIFRDGGVSRQLLKLIFFCLSVEYDKDLEQKIISIFAKHSIENYETE